MKNDIIDYWAWIGEYVERHGGNPLGLCVNACKEMSEAFPELVTVRGHVYCSWGKRGHVWLTDPDGNIVDPTRAQFPDPIHYEPWAPGEEVRVGTCMNCGDGIWRALKTLDEDPGSPSACSPECLAELEHHYNSPRAEGGCR